MIWDNTDYGRYQVVEHTGWRDIGNYETLEERAGVYVFANVDLHVKYIGKAGPGRMVKEIESAFDRGKDYGATRVMAMYTNSDKNALSLERALIDKYEPPNNYQ